MSVTILTDQDLEQMGVDMVAEALFPTVSSYDAFPTARYPSASRQKGSVDFTFFGSESNHPLIGWRVLSVTPSEPYTQVRRYELRCVVRTVHAGMNDVSESTEAAHRTCMQDNGKITEALRAQQTTSMAYGPFGIAHSTLITGKGTGATYSVLPVTFGECSVKPAEEGTGPDSLGVNKWIGTVEFTIPMLAW